ncbi:hypothetical protein HG535_0H00570 [Zygotorulaspora mrakii]|uniref:mitogen-activated protein kinase kinase n=1 Tax=Zygotorulaspora mrakii TaxID=42260 RepID=A0A7H9BAI4_ZYGMR|nr:uncharacterized protein HG535_0H00570 [Zygotorulaspora mrakii]QLG74732.1 hypothetical protein HG535_0H00570 [Zygotorulaspora mrakii]
MGSSPQDRVSASVDDHFSKLNLGVDGTLKGAGEVNSSSHGSPQASATPKRSGSTSSSAHYNNINANLHARVKAFQEQRALKRSASVGSGKNEVNPKTGKSMQQIVNKPLPPLPPSEDDLIDTSPVHKSSSIGGAKSAHAAGSLAGSGTGSGTDTDADVDTHAGKSSGGSAASDQALSNLSLPAASIPSQRKSPVTPSSMSQFNPNRRAPRRPPIIKTTSQSPTPQQGVSQPTQSLSARRGLKLPPGGMSLKLPAKGQPSQVQQMQQVQQSHAQEFAAAPSNSTHINVAANIPTSVAGRRSNPGSLVNGIQSTSTSSSNEEQRDTEGTTPRNSHCNNNNSINSGSGGGGLFANFSKYVDIKSGSLNFAGKLSLSSEGIDFSNGYSSRITLDELEFQEELGHGNYGNVSKVLHKPTNVIMAMKEVRLELDEAKFRQILMELEVLHKCQSPYIVDFYGAFFIEGAVYMCMEFMDGGSLDKIYDISPEIGGIDEPQLAYITHSVMEGLKELKDVHNIIHRDVKPTNILCSAKHGTIKLCDFGVSGNLVASLAKTNIGCQSYMAPERIRSLNPDRATYTVQSDIWSLGLSILEMALGSYPYPPETFDNIFSQLSAIVDGPPPKLPRGKFSTEAQDFVSACLQKIPERRRTYAALLEHPWLVKYRDVDVGMSDYITKRLVKRSSLLKERGENGLPKHVPALHMGGL